MGGHAIEQNEGGNFLGVLILVFAELVIIVSHGRHDLHRLITDLAKRMADCAAIEHVSAEGRDSYPFPLPSLFSCGHIDLANPTNGLPSSAPVSVVDLDCVTTRANCVFVYGICHFTKIRGIVITEQAEPSYCGGG